MLSHKEVFWNYDNKRIDIPMLNGMQYIVQLGFWRFSPRHSRESVSYWYFLHLWRSIMMKNCHFPHLLLLIFMTKSAESVWKYFQSWIEPFSDKTFYGNDWKKKKLQLQCLTENWLQKLHNIANCNNPCRICVCNIIVKDRILSIFQVSYIKLHI